MKFNKFLWQTYKESESGKFQLNIFSNLRSVYKNNNSKDILKIINSFKIEKWAENEINSHFKNVNEIVKMIGDGYKNRFKDFDDAYKILDYIWSLVPEELVHI